MPALPQTASLGARIVVTDSGQLWPTQLSRHDRAGFNKYQLREPE
jgi:hypothetical protein